MKIQVELNLEDVFEEAMYNEATLKEEFTSSVRLAIIHELIEKFKNELMRGREDAKGRRRSVLMTPPVPEKVRVLSPAWYRAAVEFQGRPEQERLAFCSWCCCHGGCNLCMDISKYNIKGLKIYGG